MNNSIGYYEENADRYIEATRDIDFHAAQDRFLKYLCKPSNILDFGCGSGRDTKYFLQKGHAVDATDGCMEFCRQASDYTGISVKQMLFQELNVRNVYDGIWACSSILHLDKCELADVMVRMVQALKTNGVVYTSFKYGDFCGERNERHFSDFTENSFTKFIEDIPELQIKDIWISCDIRPGKEEEKWLNLILQKK